MGFFIVAAAFVGVQVRAAPAARPGIEVAFSPGNAEAMVIRAMGTARRSIDVAARGRGVDVRDRSQRTGRYTSVLYLASQGISVRIDDRYAVLTLGLSCARRNSAVHCAGGIRPQLLWVLSVTTLLMLNHIYSTWPG